MLPWMCGSATLAIVVSTPCMMQATMIVAVVAARLTPRPASGGVLSPLTAMKPGR